MKTHRLAVAALLALALGTPAAAIASPGSDKGADRIRVSYADLNIHSKAGAKVLYARLQKASEDACSVDTYIRLGSLERLVKTKACYKKTLDEFVAQIDSAALQSIHSS